MADVKWSDNAHFPEATTLGGTESLVGLQGGNNTEFPISLIKNYVLPKSFVALVDQTGTANPAAVVNLNTLGATLAFVRSAQGIYTITASAGVFTVQENNTRIFLSGKNYAGTKPRCFIANVLSSTVITMAVFSPMDEDVMIDEWKLNFKIEVYV